MTAWLASLLAALVSGAIVALSGGPAWAIYSVTILTFYVLRVPDRRTVR